MADPRDKQQDKSNKASAGVNGVEQNTSRRLREVDNTVATKKQAFNKKQLNTTIASQKKRKNG